MSIDKNSIGIKTSARSAQKAYEFNIEIIDTILHRHNLQYDEAINPIKESIQNVNTQLINLEKNLDSDLTNTNIKISSSVLLNNIKENLIKQKRQCIKSKVIVQPRMPKSYSRPILLQTILRFSAIGIVSGLLLVFFIEINTNKPKP